jgi:hypothetical protein
MNIKILFRLIIKEVFFQLYMCLQHPHFLDNNTYDGPEHRCGTYRERVKKDLELRTHADAQQRCFVIAFYIIMFLYIIIFLVVLNFHSELRIIYVHCEMEFTNPWQPYGHLY